MIVLVLIRKVPGKTDLWYEDKKFLNEQKREYG